VIISELEWDDANVEHIAWHGVSQKEVDEVCYGEHLSERETRNRYVLSGKSENGRFVNVVIERIGKGMFRPITAFDMSERYKTMYRRRMGR